MPLWTNECFLLIAPWDQITDIPLPACPGTRRGRKETTTKNHGEMTRL
jgi:hypothetical protein